MGHPWDPYCTCGKAQWKCKQHNVSTQSTDKGKHSEKCKQNNVSTLSTDKGRDVISDYIRHDPQDIITCSDAVDLNSANGNRVFEIQSTKLITNEMPKGRPWGKLNNYKTAKKLSCSVKQRWSKPRQHTFPVVTSFVGVFHSEVDVCVCQVS